MKKNFILDTNILLHDPLCLGKFEDNDIYIPYPVIEELDKFKTEKGERGYNARAAIRNMSNLRKGGDIIKGIKMAGGGKLSILFNEDSNAFKLPEGFNKNSMDNLILLSIKNFMADEKKKNVYFVTNDMNMQIKAEMMGIKVQDYKNDKVAEDFEMYGGRSVRYLSDSTFDETVLSLKQEHEAIIPKTDSMTDLTENEFINLMTWSDKSYLAQYRNGKLHPLYFARNNEQPYGLVPRNLGQTFLMEALLTSHKEHPLTIVNGPAGTGKTLFAVGCGLHQVTETHEYKRVLLCRANVTMDEELGFLPGSERDKIDPLLRGAYDNLEVLLSHPDDSPEEIEGKVSFVFDRGYIDAQSLAYLRGRSITKTFIIIDEAQNCSVMQILSIITRAGEGTKIVLLGDINQIDNPRLDSRNNGLIYAMEKMKGSSLCEIVSFDESECTRSPLAKEASAKLKR